MEANQKQQVKRLIKNASNVLIFTHTHVDGDALGSSLAMAMLLNKMGKSAHINIEDPVPETFDFLPGKEYISQEITGGKDFIISVNCTNAAVESVKHEQHDSTLDIIITPKHGTFISDDVTFSEGTPRFDLIIVLDSSNLELTGKTYKENADLFYETPIINIDHHASNEYFGKVNLVDITATSTAEIVLALMESFDEGTKLMDEHIATCLLNGVITDTNSFQNANTTPKAFSIAAQLLAAGAKQQDIIKNVYKTHPLSTLKLWGKALTKIEYDPEVKLVWSALSKNDFNESEAGPAETSGVIDELLSSAPDADVVILLKEGEDMLRGSLRSIKKTIDVAKIAEVFGGGGHKRAAGFKMPGVSLENGMNEVIPRIKEILGDYPAGLQNALQEKNSSANTQQPAPQPQAQQTVEPQSTPAEPKKSQEQPTSDTTSFPQTTQSPAPETPTPVPEPTPISPEPPVQPQTPETESKQPSPQENINLEVETKQENNPTPPPVL